MASISPRPSPYAVAAGAVGYAVVVSLGKHVPADAVAAIPAFVAIAANAVERGLAAVAKVDPKVAKTADRLATQFAEAAAQVAAEADATKPAA